MLLSFVLSTKYSYIFVCFQSTPIFSKIITFLFQGLWANPFPIWIRHLKNCWVFTMRGSLVIGDKKAFSACQKQALWFNHKKSIDIWSLIRNKQFLSVPAKLHYTNPIWYYYFLQIFKLAVKTIWWWFSFISIHKNVPDLKDSHINLRTYGVTFIAFEYAVQWPRTGGACIKYLINMPWLKIGVMFCMQMPWTSNHWLLRR